MRRASASAKHTWGTFYAVIKDASVNTSCHALSAAELKKKQV